MGPTGGTAPVRKVWKEVVGCRPEGLLVQAVRPSLRVAALEVPSGVVPSVCGGWVRPCGSGWGG